MNSDEKPGLVSLAQIRSSSLWKVAAEGIDALAASITTYGLIQRLIVRPIGPGGKLAQLNANDRFDNVKYFELIDGERRFLALQELTELASVKITVRWLTDDEAIAFRAAVNNREAKATQTDEFAKLDAKAAAVQLLSERGNTPTNALTLAREALARGYRGHAKGTEDDVLMTTAKSFWARLCRDKRRFVEVKPLVFVLKEGGWKNADRSNA